MKRNRKRRLKLIRHKKFGVKKVIAVVTSAAFLFIPNAFAGGSYNYGGIKVGTCKDKTFQVENSNVDEYELTGFNAVLRSVNGANVTVGLCATDKGKFSSDLLLKNSGQVLSSLHF